MVESSNISGASVHLEKFEPNAHGQKDVEMPPTGREPQHDTRVAPRVPEAVQKSAAWILQEVARTPVPDTSHLAADDQRYIDDLLEHRVNPFSR
jgi:hypothetical protein